MASSNSASRKSSFGRTLGLLFGGVLLLLVALYFLVTSAAFFKSFVVPRVNTALGATLTVGDASISPFSGVTLRQVRLVTTEPVFAADEVTARYSLSAILGGRLEVSEVRLVAPTLTVTQSPDGKSNLDPLLQSAAGKPAAPTTQPSQPLQVSLGRLTLTRGTVTLVQGTADRTATTAIRNLEVGLQDVKNGGTGKVTLGAELMHVIQPRAARAGEAVSVDSVQGKMDGAFDFTLDQALMPAGLKGDLKLVLSQATGTFKDVAGLNATLSSDLAANDIRALVLRFDRAGQALAQVRLSGPLNFEKTEARLKLEVASVDRHVLNLLGAAQGLDFADSALNATNLVDISRQGQLVSARGKLSGTKLGVRRQDLVTPPLDLDVEYQVTADLEQKTAIVQTFKALARQPQGDLVRAALDRPMNLAWGANVHGVNEALMTLTVPGINLADWRAFLPTNAPSGLVSAELKLKSQQDGQRLALDLSSAVKDLAAQVGTNRFERLEVSFQATGQFNDFKAALLDRVSFGVAKLGRTLATGTGSASYNLDTGNASAQFNLDADLQSLLTEVPVPGLVAREGKLNVSGLLAQTKDETKATANLTLDKFTGSFGDFEFRSYQVGLATDTELKQGIANLRKATLTIREGFESGGSLDLGGKFDLTNQVGELTFNLVNLNQAAVRPFLAQALAPATLTSLALNAKGSARYHPKADTTLEVNADLANLRFNDPQGRLPATPSAAAFEVNATQRQSLVEFKKLRLSLSPETPGRNELTLQGKFDLTNRVADVTFALDFNQDGLRPYLAPALAPNTLTSISLQSKGTARYNPQGDGAVQMALELANLVLTDPEKKLPQSPFGMKAQMDVAQQKTVLELRKLALALAPTPRARNEIEVQGRLDLAPTNASPSTLKITADALDFTPLYDLFAGSPGTATADAPAPAPTPSPAPAASGSATEPGAIALPLQQLTADLNIGRLFLRDIALSNWVGQLAVRQSALTLRPFQLVANGAPVSLTGVVNLGVPGYQYDVALQADRVPLAPFADSFAPDKRGQVQGTLIANGQIKGAGVTGANLQRNLAGQVNFSLTNLNLQLVGPKMRALLIPVALAVRTPELMDSPLDVVAANARLGGGVIEVQQFTAASPAFIATAQGGTIQIAEVLTNSPLNIPVAFAMRRSLAEKARMLPANTPPDAAFAQLPPFINVVGTLGDPKTKIDPTKLAILAVGTVGNIVGGDAGKTLQGIGSFLQGGNPLAPQAPAAGATNAPTAPAPAPATNAPAAAPFNPFNLLPGLLPKKK